MDLGLRYRPSKKFESKKRTTLFSAKITIYYLGYVKNRLIVSQKSQL
jgi:hypothetical protein